MNMIAIGFLVFYSAMIPLQLALGSALIGWAPDRAIVEREKAPGPYWLSIGLQTAIAAFFAAVLFAPA